MDLMVLPEITLYYSNYPYVRNYVGNAQGFAKVP